MSKMEIISNDKRTVIVRDDMESDVFVFDAKAIFPDNEMHSVRFIIPVEKLREDPYQTTTYDYAGLRDAYTTVTYYEDTFTVAMFDRQFNNDAVSLCEAEDVTEEQKSMWRAFEEMDRAEKANPNSLHNAFPKAIEEIKTILKPAERKDAKDTSATS